MRSPCSAWKSAVGPFILLALAVPALSLPHAAAYDIKPLTDEQAEEYGLDASFYKKCTMVQNILIATSDRVSDHAHAEAAYQFDMIMKRLDPAVAQRVRDRMVLCILIGHEEFTSDVPQFTSDKTGEELDYYNKYWKDYWQRLRDKHVTTDVRVTHRRCPARRLPTTYG
jgi:hypothetical protein